MRKIRERGRRKGERGEKGVRALNSEEEFDSGGSDSESDLILTVCVCGGEGWWWWGGDMNVS